jgi:hypothetical protein
MTSKNPAPTATNPVTDRRVQPARAAAGEVEQRPTFTFDTSGFVAMRTHSLGIVTQSVRWTDLTPFQQGYVEALFASISELPSGTNPPAGEWRPFAFSDLSPEALALILRDCERQATVYTDRKPDVLDGQIFWDGRKNHVLRPYGFPPLTVSLNDAGKVCLSTPNERKREEEG